MKYKSPFLVVCMIVCLLGACQTTPDYKTQVEAVDIQRFLGTWYVIASRPTMFDNDVRNATEVYTWDEKAQEIGVLFRFQEKGEQEFREIRQVAKVYNETTKAHWKIGPTWLPISLDYLIIGLDPDYRWSAVGVPNQKYLWIMARGPSLSDTELEKILKDLAATGYRVDAVERVEHAAI